MQSSPRYQSLPSDSDNVNHLRSIILFRWIGYLLVVLFLFDLAAILYPLDLMNPDWEFQTAGNVIERIVVPIIGLGFIFWGEGHLRRKWEMTFLNLLSWTTLLMGVVLAIGIPIILVTSSQRIAIEIDTNLGNQYQEQASQFQAFQEQVEAASPDDLAAFLNRQGEESEASSPEGVRQEFLGQVETAKNELRTQVTQEIKQRKAFVKENAVKWILGGIVSGFVLAYLWHLTRWARLSLKSMKGLIAKNPRAERL